jgi:branched-chain amino acid aminotransferase
MGTVVIIDGVRFEPDDARISVFDHGFLFGDSVYDVIRTRNGRPFLMAPHLARLRRSAREIYLDIPWSDEELAAQVLDAIRASGNDECYVRVILTRGVGELELHPGTCRRPTLILIVRPLVLPPEELYRTGIRVAIVERRRMAPESLNPAAKTGNYLNNVLAIIEARRRGADDAVMLGAVGQLTEGTTANLFVVRGGVVRTPSLDSGILGGITRELTLSIVRDEGIDCFEETLLSEDLDGADEAFLTSTTRDILPIRQVGETVLSDGAPGPVTRRIMDRFAAIQGAVGK